MVTTRSMAPSTRRRRPRIELIEEDEPNAVRRRTNVSQALQVVPVMRVATTQAGFSRLAGRKKMSKRSRQEALIRKWKNEPVFPQISGRGDYKTFFRNVGRGISTIGKALVPSGTFSKLGSALGGGIGTVGGAALGSLAGPAAGTVGGYAGGIGGGMLGAKAGDSFAKMVGFGDYQVKVNSLMDLPMGKTMAAFGNMSNATIVRHREFVQNIKVPSPADAFTNQVIALNPGLRSVFPWLSTIAGNYQEYQFLGCVFEYRSLSSDSASSLPLGSVTIASNYDTADPAYGDKREMLNSQFCVSGKPSTFMIHPIECDPKVTFVPIKYTRNGAPVANTDSRLYDHCHVQVATEGLPGTAGDVIGELWISYEIALYKPQLGVTSALRDHFWIPAATYGAIVTASPLSINAAGATPLGGTSNGLGISLTPLGIVCPIGLTPGRYEIWMSWRGTIAFATGPITFTPASSSVAVSPYYNGGVTAYYGQSTVAVDATGLYRLDAHCVITVPQPLLATNLISVTGYTSAAGCTSLELQVASLPQGQQ